MVVCNPDETGGIERDSPGILEVAVIVIGGDAAVGHERVWLVGVRLVARGGDCGHVDSQSKREQRGRKHSSNNRR